MASLGFDLPALINQRRLVLEFVQADRTELEQSGEYNLEGLFIRLGHAIDSIGAKRVVLDTLENLFSALPNPAIVRAELRRLFAWLKARGVTAVTLTRQGVVLRNPYLGAAGVLTGSARLAQEATEQGQRLRRAQEVARKQAELATKRDAMEAQILAIRAEFKAVEAAALVQIDQSQRSEQTLAQDRVDMAASRMVNPA